MTEKSICSIQIFKLLVRQLHDGFFFFISFQDKGILLDVKYRQQLILKYSTCNTVDGFSFVGTNFCGLNRNGIFVWVKIRGYYIFLHKSYRK